MTPEIGQKAPDFDLAVTREERARLADLRRRGNVLLVFHPFAWTPVCEEEARDLQENLHVFRQASTEVVWVSCDPWPSRQAWKEKIGAEYVFASDFWPHGEAARAYGVFDESRGAPVRGTFLIDAAGTLVWRLVHGADESRAGLFAGSLRER